MVKAWQFKRSPKGEGQFARQGSLRPCSSFVSILELLLSFPWSSTGDLLQANPAQVVLSNQAMLLKSCGY